MSMSDVGVILREFRDCSEQERGLEGWFQRYEQTAPGRYEGSIRRLGLPGVTITRERINVAVEQWTAPPVGSKLFSCTLPDSLGYRVNANQVQSGDCYFLGGGQETMAALPENSDILFVEYEAALAPQQGPETSIAPNSSAAQAVVSWLLTLVMSCPLDEGAGAVELARILPGLIMDRLSFLHAASDLKPRRNFSAETDYQVFRKARDIIEEDPQQPPSVGALCFRLDLPEAMVRQAFIRSVGVGPIMWIRQHRLNNARRDLLRGGEAGASVSEIATKWGFWHLGRFSSYYAQLFGETPSQTFRKASR